MCWWYFLKNSGWKWGEHKLPKVSLDIAFASNGAWDVHLKRVLHNGRNKVNQLRSIISNRDINLSAHSLLLLSVIRPSIEYGSEVWEGNKGRTNALESVVLGGAEKVLGCSSKTCNEAVKGGMGLETLKSRRDKVVVYTSQQQCLQDRYPKQLFSQEWNIKPGRGRRRKTWDKVIDDIFLSLCLDNVNGWRILREKIRSSLASLMSCVEKCISERECRKYEEGLNNRITYKTFSKGLKVLAWSE